MPSKIPKCVYIFLDLKASIQATILKQVLTFLYYTDCTKRVPYTIDDDVQKYIDAFTNSF